MVGILLSFWETIFSGAFAVSFRGPVFFWETLAVCNGSKRGEAMDMKLSAQQAAMIARDVVLGVEAWRGDELGGLGPYTLEE